jgi:FeS assembly SUF system protein
MTDDTETKTAEPTAAPAETVAPTDAAPVPVAEAVVPRLTPSASASIPEAEVERITADLIGVLKTVYDPEIPVDIYELGLIYKVDLDDDRNLTIDMTLTAPGCPVAGEMPGWVENAALSVEGVKDVKVNMVFDPPWGPERMSEEAQVALNWW